MWWCVLDGVTICQTDLANLANRLTLSGMNTVGIESIWQ